MKTNKLVTSAIASMALAGSALANPITGTISFNGNVTPYVTANGTGAQATDYSMAHSLVFAQTLVSAGANGSFAGVPMNSMVNFYSPLHVNPPGLPTPNSTPLWTTVVGGFTFTLQTLTEDMLVAPFNTLTLRGTGVLSDGNSADDTAGTWVATFTEANAPGGATFSWNSSSAADFPAVPEAAQTLMLLGMVCAGMGAYKVSQGKQV